MKLIQIHEGVLELQWAWLPYWIACQSGVRADVERRLQASLQATAEPDTEALGAEALLYLKQRFPDAATVLDAIAAAPC